MNHLSTSQIQPPNYSLPFMNCTADLAAAAAAAGAPPPPRSSRCRDCGNQAKKDCQHSRCRTCCKGRGFHCLTHVKSTWVPVSRRRPRPRHLTTHFYSYSPAAAAVGHQMGSSPKRHRETYSPNLGSEGIFDNFPAEMRFPAVFRCVRVRSADNAVDQYAYQTSVSIGGRVFAGILYDHGPEGGAAGGCLTRESSSSGDGSGSLHLQQANNILITRGNAAVGTLPSSQLPICVGTRFLAFSNSTTPTTTNYSNLFQFPKS